jgi:hypothetical protein
MSLPESLRNNKKVLRLVEDPHDHSHSKEIHTGSDAIPGVLFVLRHWEGGDRIAA